MLNPNYQSILNSVEKNGTSKLKTTSGDFFITKKFLEIQNNNEGYIFAYLDAPAINSGLTGAIYEIDGAKINSLEGLSKNLKNILQKIK